MSTQPQQQFNLAWFIHHIQAFGKKTTLLSTHLKVMANNPHRLHHKGMRAARLREIESLRATLDYIEQALQHVESEQ